MMIPMTSPLLQPAQRPEGIGDPYHVYLDSLPSPETQRVMRIALNSLVGLVLEDEAGPAAYEAHGPVTGEGRPWWLLRVDDVRHILGLLTAPERAYAAANVNKKMVALRGVLETCWELRLMPAEDYLRAVRELRTLPVTAKCRR